MISYTQKEPPSAETTASRWLFALAILDDDSLSHPRLECLFTTGEEVGLLGAKDFDASHMKGRRLINIDSEEEGIFTVSCAGGMDGILHIPAVYQETEGVRYTGDRGRSAGGHSGAEIHKEHGNSNILMGRPCAGWTRW